jgi:hypothetical protein
MIMNGELRMAWKEAVVTYGLSVLFLRFPEGTDKSVPVTV